VTLPVITVRPEPGAAATVERLAMQGIDALAAPLFAVAPLSWQVPDPSQFDALLLTSANALRHGGPQLAQLLALPAWCVGETTASAARTAGFAIAQTGSSDAASLLAAAPAQRWLWLAGEVQQPLGAAGGASLVTLPVYASRPVPPSAPLMAALERPAILLAHSAAAAARLRELVGDPARHLLVAISPAVVAAAGPGWRAVQAASRPDDSEMVALAARLCQNAAHE
jgi:uroporphyrinogen-III synthase